MLQNHCSDFFKNCTNSKILVVESYFFKFGNKWGVKLNREEFDLLWIIGIKISSRTETEIIKIIKKLKSCFFNRIMQLKMNMLSEIHQSSKENFILFSFTASKQIIHTVKNVFEWNWHFGRGLTYILKEQ